MRRTPASLVLIALVLLAILAAVTGTSAAKPKPATVGTAPVTSTTLVCPAVDGAPAGTKSTAIVTDVAGALTPPSTSTGSVTATVLGGAKSTATALKVTPTATINSKPNVTQAIAFAATGSVAATLAADQVGITASGRYRALTSARCVSPATDWWFVGADGRVGYTDALDLANPSPIAADVSIALYGAKGPIANNQLEAIRVGGRSTVRLSIAEIAPDDPTIGIHVHATSGAVTAALVDRRTSALNSDGGDFVPSTAGPSRFAVVPGFGSGSGPRRLFLTDPGGIDATVSLQAVTTTGSFTPVGANQLLVRSGSTREISLDRALDGTTGAVVVTSDQPVVAQGLSVAQAPSHRPDLMWLATVAHLAGPAAIAAGKEPEGGQTLLLLAAPRGAAGVTVTALNGKTQTIPVAAGRTAAVNISSTVSAGGGQWGFVVTPTGSAPVYVTRVLQLSGANGPLITSEPLVGLPTPIKLPAVTANPLAAVR